MEKSAVRTWGLVGLIAAGSLAVRLAFATSVGIFQDEALYWWLAQDAGVSFSPHPPAIVLLVRWGAALLGPGVLGVRMGSLLCGTLGVVLAAVLAAEFYDRRAAVWAAGLFAACPLLTAVGAVTTPDALLVCVWLLFVWVTWRAAATDRLGWWVASGAVLALGGYTKYMMALAVPCAALALLSSARGRRRLRRPGPWVAALVAVAFFVVPFLAWNAQHDWAPLRYHLAARQKFQVKVSRVGVYAGGHLAAISPGICIGVFMAFAGLWRRWRRSRSERDAWLLCFGLLPILFFLPPSLLTVRHLMRVQWDLIGYATGIVALAGLIAGRDEAARPRRRLGIAALAAALPITVGLVVLGLLPGLTVALGARPPTVRMLGWKALAAKVRALEHDGPWQRPHFILTARFDTALCLAYQRRSRQGIYTIRQGSDRAYGLTPQLEAWGIDEESALVENLGDEALFIYEFRHPNHPSPNDGPRRVFRYFERLEPLGQAQVALDGQVVRRFGLYRASQILLPP